MPGFHTLCCAGGPTPPSPPPPPRAGLWYRMSTSRFEAVVAQVDPESVLTFTLPEDSYVLIIYNASNRHDSTESAFGKTCFIDIDDEYYPNSLYGQAPYVDNVANSVTCTWAGRLPAGAHTVATEVYSNGSLRPVGIDVRQVIVLAVPVSSGPLVYGTSVYQAPCVEYGLDAVNPLAKLSFNLNDEADVLTVYNISKEHGHSQTAIHGLIGYLYLDGRRVPESRYYQRILHREYASGVTSMTFHRLGAGIHSIIGGVELNSCVSTSTLAYIVAPKPWVSAGRMSSNFITGSQDIMGSPPPWDDPNSVVTIDLAEDSLCLAVYNVQTITRTSEGEFTLINVDGVDMSESFASQSTGRDFGDHQILSLWAGRLTAGTHTIKGRWGPNKPTGMAELWYRVIAVICIPEPLTIP